MKLLKLEMTNFIPYKGKSTVVFPQDPDINVMVVFGSNMTGKTSLLNAIRWVLYGKALGRHMREIPLHEILNREAANTGDYQFEVAISFTDSGHFYDLRRRATKRSMVSRPSRPEDFEIEVGMQKDGSALSAYLIEPEINRFAPEQVSRFFLFDGELLKEYETLLIEGSEQGRQIKEAIEQVLGVPALANGRDDCRNLLKGLRKSQNSDMAAIEGLKRQAHKQTEWQDKFDTYERDLARLSERLDLARRERSALDDELESVESVYQAKAQLNGHLKRRQEIEQFLDVSATKRRTLVSDAWRDVLRPCVLACKESLYRQQAAAIEELGQRQRLLMRAEDLRRILSSAVCPTCGRATEESKLDGTRRELAKLESEIAQMPDQDDEIVEIASRIREMDKIIQTSVVDSISHLDFEIQSKNIELTRIENEIERIRDEIQGYDTNHIEQARAKRDRLLAEEGRLEHERRQCSENLEKCRREIEALSKVLEGLPQLRESRSTAMVQTCVGLEKSFSESIVRLREKLRHRVEERATEAFLKLTTQEQYSGLEINDNYGLNILDEKGAVVTNRSAGAEQIVALSLIDGLARSGRTAGPVVMDTPFGRLDLGHRDNILRYLPKTAGQLVLLVHDGEIRRETDLAPIASRIGLAYEIREVSPSHSKIEKVTA